MLNFGELLQNLIPIPIQHILSSVWEPPETDHTRRCQAGLQRGFDPTLSNDPKSNAQPLKFDPGRRICAPLRVGNPRHTGSGRRRRPDPQKILIGENNFFISPTELTTRGDGSFTPYAKRTATSSALSPPCGRYQAELHMMLHDAIRPRITTNNIVYARNAAYSTSHSIPHLPGGPLHGTRCKTPHAKSLGCAREPPRRARQEITTPGLYPNLLRSHVTRM